MKFLKLNIIYLKILITLMIFLFLLNNTYSKESRLFLKFYKLAQENNCNLDDNKDNYNEDSECEEPMGEEACTIYYEKCLESCKDEDCMDKCDVEYENCMDSLE